MHPIFLDLGFVQIRYYGLMYAVALLIGMRLILAEIKRRELACNEDHILNAVITAFLGALLGARLYYVFFFDPAYYWQNPAEFLAVWHGGLAIHGGIIGGVLAGWLACRHYRIHPWQFADLCAPAVLLGQALGRFGNLMNGDAYGAATNLPWGLVYAPGTPAYIQHGLQPSHPAMVYELLLDFIFFCVLCRLQKQPRRDGFLFCLYLIFYSVARSIVSCFRADDLYLCGLNLPQLASAVLICGGFYFILRYQLYRAESK
ncbi:MAG: prolipoprotein diacylglyceryl transferase [Candidatus Margulisbacteria bacterium]|jgi:phosphatidylglycerol:prolipoprotein diacylglycerol transferase|nr:prolipoprotein diacylglyceryl transferase [Candidatus Margulisiibacteriota bacterium]